MQKIVLLLGVTIIGLAAVTLATGVQAASVTRTIYANSGTSGANAGCFTSSSNPNCSGNPAQYNLTVTQGDEVTITFVVPSGDPYCCGAQVKGDGGQFDTGTISAGSSKQVNFTASSSFNFTSYWPNTSTVKAHGSVTVNAPVPDPPDKPTGLSAVGISTTQIKLTWDSSAGATSYKVQRGGTTIDSVSGTEFTDSGLQSNTSYSYKVIATNSDGDSDPSSSVSAKTKAKSTSSSSNDTSSNEEEASNEDPEDKLFIDERGYFVQIDDKAFGFDALPAIWPGQKFEIFGTSVEGAKVTIEMNGSEIAAATAKKTGEWTTEVDTTELEVGNYEIVITVTDNGQSATEKLTLEVTEKEEAMEDQENTTAYEYDYSTEEDEDDSNLPLLIAIGGGTAAAAAAGAGGYYWLRIRPRRLAKVSPVATPPISSTQTISPVADSGSTSTESIKPTIQSTEQQVIQPQSNTTTDASSTGAETQDKS